VGRLVLILTRKKISEEKKEESLKLSEYVVVLKKRGIGDPSLWEGQKCFRRQKWEKKRGYFDGWREGGLPDSGKKEKKGDCLSHFFKKGGESRSN